MTAEQPPGPAGTKRASRLTVQGLRRLILAALALGVLTFTTGVFVLVQRIFKNFGPAVQSDLDWKTLRGAREMALSADLGLAVGDSQLVTQAFGDYLHQGDVIAIVAVDKAGKVVAAHGTLPESVNALFAGDASSIRRTPSYVVSWAHSEVEGNTVGQVALVISTRRLVEAQSFLRRISWITAGSGLLAFIVGLLFVNFFTRSVAERDLRLAEHASSLEHAVAERTVELGHMNRGMRMVLDNVDQGFVTVGLDGKMSSERSTVMDRWFGVPQPGTTFGDYIRAADSSAADIFALGLAALVEDALPRELLLDQLPRRMSHGSSTLSISYRPILAADGEAIERLLIVITDITDDLARQKVERDWREMLNVFQRANRDRAGVEQFFSESAALIEQIAAGAETAELERRLIHTVKGNCALFGLESISHLCHDLETRLEEENERLSDLERRRFRDQWDHVTELLREILGERRSPVDLDQEDLTALLRAVRSRAPHEEIAALAESWRHEPVSLRLTRLAEKARYSAQRLGKPSIVVHTDGGGLRLDADRWAPFWAALVHAVNNAVDHGIEDATTRANAQKPRSGRLWLLAAGDGSDLVITVRDDGRGVDWERLSQRAAAKGLPHATRADLVAAMFADGVSTSEQVTIMSGRGVGLAALREATVGLGGNVDVVSEKAGGTTLTFRFRGALRSTQSARPASRSARV